MPRKALILLATPVTAVVTDATPLVIESANDFIRFVPHCTALAISPPIHVPSHVEIPAVAFLMMFCTPVHASCTFVWNACHCFWSQMRMEVIADWIPFWMSFSTAVIPELTASHAVLTFVCRVCHCFWSQFTIKEMAYWTPF